MTEYETLRGPRICRCPICDRWFETSSGGQSPDRPRIPACPACGVTVASLTCGRCGHIWQPSTDRMPRVCPKCKNPYWDRARSPPGRPRDSPGRS